MPTNGPIRTPYEQPLVGTPGVGEATTQGAGVTLNEGGGQTLIGTPFEKPLVAAPGQSPSPNSSGIPNTWTTTGGIPNAPAEGSHVENSIASPNTPSAGLVTGS